MKKKQKFIYVVTMYKYGNRSDHSYVLCVKPTAQSAIDAGEEEQAARGGNKYFPEVLEFSTETFGELHRKYQALIYQ